MTYLIDTNVLLRIRDKDDPRHSECVAAIDLLKNRSEHLFVCAQVLTEFWCGSKCFSLIRKNLR